MTQDLMRDTLDALLFSANTALKNLKAGIPVNFEVLLQLQVEACEEALRSGKEDQK